MSKVEIMSLLGWIFYVSEDYEGIDSSKCGKWMYFFDNKDFAAEICHKAVSDDICQSAKHSDDESGVCCFYINADDIPAHKRVIQFFLDNNLIKRTKDGRLYNISFKFDDQTKIPDVVGFSNGNSLQLIVAAINQFMDDAGITYMDTYDTPCKNGPDRYHEQLNVVVYSDGRGFAVDYFLATNGEINDLTLQMEFLVDLNGN